MYSQIFELHASLLKSLSHPRRLEILQLLRNQELSVTEIYTMLDLPQANISQNLKILKSAGVINSKKDGKQIYYRIADPKFIKASDLFRSILVERNRSSGLADEFTIKMSDLVPLARDPVCGMRLSPKTSAFAYSHQHKEYYFCAGGCLKKFKEQPGRYAE